MIVTPHKPLDRNNIKIDEAVTGEVKTEPSVPGIMPNKNALQEYAPVKTAEPPTNSSSFAHRRLTFGASRFSFCDGDRMLR